MTDTNANTEALLQAAHIGHAVAALIAASRDSCNTAADHARSLAKNLADQAMQLATPVVTITAKDTGGLAAYTGHASDCSTNNRGVPETVGDCDCGAGLTLESYFKDNQARGVIDFSLRACHLPDGEVGFYLHPASVDGHTPQFTVKGNVLTTHTPA